MADLANKIQVRRGLKANLPTLDVGEPGYCTDTKELFIGNGTGVNTNVITATTSSITYHVDVATGNDNNNGSAGTPFKTIGKAISLMPRVVDHTYYISVAAGNYNEVVMIECRTGKGSIQLQGAFNVSDAANWTVTKIHYKYNTVPVYVKGFTATITDDVGIGAEYNPGYSEIHHCRVVSAGSGRGIVNYYCPYVLMNECEVSNRSVGIYTSGGRTWGLSHTGTGNVVGLYVEKVGTYGKSGTQPGGTTAEGTGAGGQIISA